MTVKSLRMIHPANKSTVVRYDAQALRLILTTTRRRGEVPAVQSWSNVCLSWLLYMLTLRSNTSGRRPAPTEPVPGNFRTTVMAVASDMAVGHHRDHIRERGQPLDLSDRQRRWVRPRTCKAIMVKSPSQQRTLQLLPRTFARSLAESSRRTYEDAILCKRYRT